MLQEALDFARNAHGEQQRKYTHEPYIEHPIRVAEMVKSVPHTEAMICAAYLHDVVEDTPVAHQEIEERFGPEVARLVHELTDEYMKEAYPGMNRKKTQEKRSCPAGHHKQRSQNDQAGRCDRQYPRHY